MYANYVYRCRFELCGGRSAEVRLPADVAREEAARIAEAVVRYAAAVESAARRDAA